jgi:hypothetical protein
MEKGLIRLGVLFMIFLLAFIYCGGNNGGDNTNNSIKLSVQFPFQIISSTEPSIQPESENIKSITIIVEGSDFSTIEQTFNFPGQITIFVPVGTNRTFSLEAFDADAQLIFTGTLGGVTISPGENTVTISLIPVVVPPTPPPPTPPLPTLPPPTLPPPTLPPPTLPPPTLPPPTGRKNVNNLVTFNPNTSTCVPVPRATDCPSGFVGECSITARLTDKSTSPPLSDLLIRVNTLTNGNLLANADRGPGGVGATLTPPSTSLNPGESEDVQFLICLTPNGASFDFFVDVLGVVQ